MIVTKQVHTPVFPRAVLWKKGGAAHEEVLLKEKALALPLFVDVPCFDLPAGASVLLDFGKEIAGGLRLMIESVESKENRIPLRLRLGESAGETMVDVPEHGATRDHSPHDRIVEVPSLSDNSFFQSGFRFARLDNLGQGGVHFYAILAMESHVDAPRVGYFHSNDEQVNRIFEAADRTAYLCAQNDYIYDGIKRDRLVWCGDLGIEIRTLLESYGPLSNIKNAIGFCRDSNPLPHWINAMPTYSLWWIDCLNSYFRATGDQAYLRENLPYLSELVHQLSACVSPEGILDLGGPKELADFIDWPSHGTEDAHAGAVAMLKIALEEAADLLRQGGASPEEASSILARLKKVPMGPKALKGLLCLQSLAWGEKESERLLKGGGANMSTFMAYPIFKALAKEGHYEEALSLMKEYYGAMLEKGATTFFEDFQMEWAKDDPIDVLPREGRRYLHADNGRFCYQGYRMSLCHGWASGPLPYLLEEVAGLRLENADTLLFDPHPSGLSDYEAAVYTKEGVAKMSCREGKFHLEAPASLRVERKK